MGFGARHGDDAALGKLFPQDPNQREPAVPHHDIAQDEVGRIRTVEVRSLQAISRQRRRMTRQPENLRASGAAADRRQ